MARHRDVSLSASFCGLRIQWGREPGSGLSAKRNRGRQRRLTLICWTARIRSDVRHPRAGRPGASPDRYGRWLGRTPTTEAIYVGVEPSRTGDHELTLKDVPVDAFWSISVYKPPRSLREEPVRPPHRQQRQLDPESRRVRDRFVTGKPKEIP